MNVIFQSCLLALKRYRTPVILNVVGLAIAFAAFYVILSQVRWEYSIDRFHPAAERLYRVEQLAPEEEGGQMEVIFSRQLTDRVRGASAQIDTLTTLYPEGRVSFLYREPNGRQHFFTESLVDIEPAWSDMLSLEITEGTVENFATVNDLLIPESVARRIFGERSAVGEQLEDSGAGRMMTVAAVYRDLPDCSVVGNAIYRRRVERLDPWVAANNFNEQLFVRLTPGADPAEVARTVGDRLAESDGVRKIRIVNIRDIYYETDARYDMIFAEMKGNRAMTAVLLGIALLVIFIAAVNFINFSSAMAPVRIKAINLQKIMGAGRWTLCASLVAEAVAVAMLAWVVAMWAVTVAAGSPLGRFVDVSLYPFHNWPMVLITGAAALVTGVAAGLYPALYMTSFRPILAIRGAFAGTAAGRRYRMVLVVVQFAISSALVIATIFMERQNRLMQRLDTGYDKAGVVTFELPGSLTPLRVELRDAIGSDPAVEAVAYADDRFGAVDNCQSWGRSFKGRKIQYYVVNVTPEMLDVLGIDIDDGRGFEPNDQQREIGAYIFNEAARERYGLQLGDRVADEDLYDGRHFNGWGEVVGFLDKDFRAWSCHRAEEPFCFYVYNIFMHPRVSQLNICYLRLAARTDKMAAVERIRKVLREKCPYEIEIHFLDEQADRLYAADRKAGTLVSLFALLAIAVSLTGVFGLVLFETQHRRRETGIRRVFGATVGEILAGYNRRFALLVAVGFAVAAPVAWWGVRRWLEGFTYRVDLSAWVFALAFVVVGAVVLLTVTLRSWHTAGENPVSAIKGE